MQQSRESKAAHMGIQMRIDNTCEKGFASPRSSHQPPQCHSALWDHAAMATMVQIEGPENIRGGNMSLTVPRWGYCCHAFCRVSSKNQGQHSGPCLEAPGVCFLQLFFWLIDFFLPNEEFWCRWAFDEPWVICVTAPLCLKLRHLIIPRGSFPSRGWSAKRWEAF